MRVCVFIEDVDGRPTDDSLAVAARAARAGLTVEAARLGATAAGDDGELGAHGIDVLHAVHAPALAAPLPQPCVDALANLCEQERFDGVLFATTTLAADVAAGLAARMEAGLNWDLVDVETDGDELVGTRLVFGDGVLTRVGWRSSLRLALFRPGAFERAPVRDPRPALLRERAAPVQDWSRRVELLERQGASTGSSSLRDAEVVVTGGRGLGSPEALRLVYELADALGGSAAATLPVVERGWAPYSMQVGQTGAVVRPRLYVACGVSGQIQHRVGMERSGTIVAINTDEHAPIFGFSDLAVVADARQVLPQLTALVRAAREVVGQA
jgi:electron transfer flavoprotein alpha subunit